MEANAFFEGLENPYYLEEINKLKHRCEKYTSQKMF